MKRKLLAIIIIFFAYFANITTSYSEVEKPAWAPNISGGVTFETKYIWRGQLMVDDPVMQPDASLSKYGLTLAYWGNYSTASTQEKFTEHNYIVDYTVNIGELREFLGTGDRTVNFIDPLSVSFGNIVYVFPECSGLDFHSEEFYLGISCDTFLQPFFTWYMDYARGAGSYLEFGVAHTLEMSEGINAGLGITAAYNAGQWGYGYKFAPVLFSGGVNITVLKYFTITPNINYSLAVDRSRKDDGAAYGSEFYGGIKVSVGI